MICGVDVAKQNLDARIGEDGMFLRVPNTEAGIAQLAEFCRQQGVHLVAMEASGGYEKKPFALLWARGIPVALLNPRGVRHFAEAMGVLEKTDRIDCGIIACFAAAKKCTATLPPTAPQEQMKALVTRLRQLTELRAAQHNQRLLVTEPAVRRSFKALVAVLDKQIRTLEARIAKLIASDPLWQQLDRAFRSIKGVANRTVARLMAEMPEIGVLPNKKISKLAGLAPLARDSGNTQGKRVVRGGRRNIRDILFWISAVVARYNPDFLAFRQRLTLAGKPKKVIRIALAHKLLVRLNAKAREVRLRFAEAAQVALVEA